MVPPFSDVKMKRDTGNFIAVRVIWFEEWHKESVIRSDTIEMLKFR